MHINIHERVCTIKYPLYFLLFLVYIKTTWKKHTTYIILMMHISFGVNCRQNSF